MSVVHDPSPSTEPKPLDPLPWLNPHAMTRQSDNRDGWRVFAPRPEFSQDLSTYENGAK